MTEASCGSAEPHQSHSFPPMFDSRKPLVKGQLTGRAYCSGLSVEVHYTCWKCGKDFILKQFDPEPDMDIGQCWDCIDKMFTT